jgi:hypothetical protein
MPARAPRLVLLAPLLAACSEPSEIDAGTFQAHLTGATSGTLSGSSAAGVVYTEDRPDGSFTIRMLAVEGGVRRVVVLTCPGLSAPGPGSHSLDPAEGGCTGRYSRFTLDSTLQVLEEAESSGGTVRVQESSPDRTVGSFDFRGELVRGTDSLGTVQASGNFSAIASP